MDDFEQAIEQWGRRLGKGKEFYEQQLWKERAPKGRHNVVAWCNMSRRLKIKKILIAGLRAGLVDCAGPGKWIIN